VRRCWGSVPRSSTAPGIAAAESGYEVDGNAALLLESVGYYVLTTGIMLGGAMAIAAALSNRRVHLVPGWTLVLAALVGLATVGSIFTAWLGFILFPLWAIAVGICLLAAREPAVAEEREPVAAQ
jgi:hypothetical protein